MLAACTSESENGPSANISYESIAATQQVPVTFGTYIGETPVTRTGTTGNINTNAKLQAPGFGVFGYYTNAGDYNAAPGGNTSLHPNFMYNQHVTYSTGWTYTPIKYWPNETQSDGSSAVDGNGATSTGGIDKLSFFAYAPWVNVTVGTGAITTSTMEDSDGDSTPDLEVGITALSANNANSDPIVSYTVASLPENTVDLLWGVIPATTTYATVTGSQDLSANAGKPNLNLTKQTVSETVDFIFKHALAKINFTVQGYFDERSLTGGGAHQDPTNDVAAGTKIVVEKVDITSTFHKVGTLNLYNGTANTPNWSYVGATTAGFNVVNSSINTGIKYTSSPDTYNGQTAAGVDNTKKALFADADHFFALFPETGKTMDITITYHVFTEDTNLAGSYSKITNVIKKQVSGFNPVAGNAYNINLQLGMTTVKVTATVADWDAGAEQYVDLPINVN